MKRRILAGCLRKNKAALILFAATAALNGAVFALYGVMTEAFWYAEALLFASGSPVLTEDIALILKLKKFEIISFAKSSKSRRCLVSVFLLLKKLKN